MDGLGRINLLVGTNNSGKTSVLEAIHLLAASGDPYVLWQMLWRRGERLPASPMQGEEPARRVEVDVASVFHGYDAQPGVRTRIQGTTKGILPRWIECTVVSEVPDQKTLFETEVEISATPRLALQVTGSPPYPPLSPISLTLPLTRRGGLLADPLDPWERRGRRQHDATYFVTTASLSVDELIAMWNNVALTPSEDLVLSALRVLDPKIERIAVQAPTSVRLSSGQTRGGFIVKHRDFSQPVPIGSMGDGMWRMLVLALVTTQCKGGVLLVDEVDTGLHYTVMAQMWKLLFHAAKEFDVQVFATTHSSDCIYSLAEAGKRADRENAISVQRIDASKKHSVPYDQDEIAVAAAKEIEVR